MLPDKYHTKFRLFTNDYYLFNVYSTWMLGIPFWSLIITPKYFNEINPQTIFQIYIYIYKMKCCFPSFLYLEYTSMGFIFPVIQSFRHF
jgi:hypothetical protein